MPSPSRSIQQLAELREQGSQSFKPNPLALDGRPAGNHPPTSSASWWNLIERMRQAFQTEKAQSELFKSQLSHSLDVQRQQNDAKAEASKYAIEHERIVVDDRMQRRAEKAIARSKARSLIYTADAIELGGFYIDRKRARIQSTFQDPAIKEKTNDVLLSILDHLVTDLQICAIGSRFGVAPSGEPDGR